MLQVVTGTYSGAGAAQDIVIGFKPSAVTIINVTDSVVFDWNKQMNDGTAVNTTAGTAVAANGVTHFVGEGEGGKEGEGFTVGTALATAAKTFAFTAHR